jgi:hypothetical protein
MKLRPEREIWHRTVWLRPTLNHDDGRHPHLLGQGARLCARIRTEFAAARCRQSPSLLERPQVNPFDERQEMIRESLTAILAAALSVLLVQPALADPGEGDRLNGLTDPGILALITDDDLFAVTDLVVILSPPTDPPRTQRYGPYESGSPDSGTCGNDWAEDTFERVFFVREESATSFTIVQQFKHGSFVTNAGPSPGACDVNDGTPPGTVTAGIIGSMHGYFIISVSAPAGQTSTDPACQPTPGCTTAGFIESHFAGSTFTVGTFFFHYSGYDGSNKQLVVHSWKNASADRGGNRGDIASAQP